MQIDLTGWTHVQTWHESHGVYTEHTYQKEQTDKWLLRRAECLVISTYRDGRPSSVRTESQNDYLMARDIRANPTRYAKTGARSIEPCCTAGSDDFVDTETDQRWRIFGAAGHGEWAFKLADEDA